MMSNTSGRISRRHLLQVSSALGAAIATPSQLLAKTESSIQGAGPLPGWFVKLVALALIWAFLHHLFAGMRHLWMDMRHAVSKEFGKASAIWTLCLSIGLTIALGAKLFGLY